MLLNFIRPLVRDILKAPLRREWTLQGFGMLRTYLSKELRLHVWDDRYAVPNVTLIHDHPWDFESLVVSGKIRDQLYWIDPHGKPTYVKSTIVCGVGGGEVKEYVPVSLHSTGVIEIDHVYQRPSWAIHSSHPSRGAVTLCKRSFKENTEHAHVFYPIGEKWVSAEPRPASKLEVESICKHALEVFPS